METVYFVCDRVRASVDVEYALWFYDNKQYKKLYDNPQDAQKEINEGFYDDSSVVIVEYNPSKGLTLMWDY